MHAIIVLSLITCILKRPTFLRHTNDSFITFENLIKPNCASRSPESLVTGKIGCSKWGIVDP